MANTERGGSIREYIDARKKGGMTWDEFRKLKSEVDGPQFSEYELVQYRQQLDDERDAKLKGVSGSKSHSPIGNRNFSEDGYYEDYEKRRMDDEDVLDVEKERHDRHSKRKERSSSIEPVQEEEHTGDTPVRLSEFLKHGSSSSDE
ncbi:10514_t:CDS:2 [Funneliformis mosseae]|uniref:10514_t:CDS:1 n=1 Tax=Funneliformis mosseae TaxID=27381 RepID=A0A9N8Z1T2_FUNMO|nr:10514_t:CDS:2 [Funneliformis mosseae]